MSQRWKLTSLYLTIMMLLTLATPAGASAQAPRTAYRIDISGPITVVTASYLERAIDKAEADGAAALVVVLNTPGGGLTTTREMVALMRASTVPIVVYIGPAGATAASAGTIITLAAHAAAMSPGTSIGAASPVSMEGEMGEVERRKAENIIVADLKALAERRPAAAQEWAERAVTESAALSAAEALALGVVDAVADTPEAALSQLQGLEVVVAGGATTLDAADLTLEPISLSLVEQLLDILLDPNIAFILVTIGLNAILFELSSPGGYVAGIVGAICLVLGFFALGVLDVNWTGVGLIILAFVLFIADVVTPSLGLLTGLGVLSLALGSMILFSSPLYQVSLVLVLTVALFSGAFMLFVVAKTIAAQRHPPTTGTATLVGKLGQVRQALDPQGLIMVSGELWQARSESGPLPEGATVRVLSVEGLLLTVEAE